jgi:hypothetical protein
MAVQTMPKRKKARRRPAVGVWQGAFPKLLNDPSKEARREGREMAKELLADLDRDLEKDRKRASK